MHTLHPLHRLCHIQHRTLCTVHFTTFTTPSHGPIALHAVLHLLQHCHKPQHCTRLHICQVMPRTYSIAPAVVPIGCILGTQHDHPQVTTHTLSITHGIASIRLCHRPTTLHTTLHAATFPLGHTSYSLHCILLYIQKAGSQVHSMADYSISSRLCLIFIASYSAL